MASAGGVHTLLYYTHLRDLRKFSQQQGNTARSISLLGSLLPSGSGLLLCADEIQVDQGEMLPRCQQPVEDVLRHLRERTHFCVPTLRGYTLRATFLLPHMGSTRFPSIGCSQRYSPRTVWGKKIGQNVGENGQNPSLSNSARATEQPHC